MKTKKSKKELLLSAGLILTATLGLTACSSNTVTPAPETNTGETVEVETDTTTETSKPSIETETESNEDSKQEDTSNKEDVIVSNHPFGTIEEVKDNCEKDERLTLGIQRSTPCKVGSLTVSSDLLTEENFVSFYHEQIKNSDYDLVEIEVEGLSAIGNNNYISEQINFIGTNGLFGVNYLSIGQDAPFANGMILADDSIIFAGTYSKGKDSDDYEHTLESQTHLFDKETHAWMIQNLFGNKSTNSSTTSSREEQSSHPFGEIEQISSNWGVKDGVKAGKLSLYDYEGTITEQDILNFYYEEIKNSDYEFVILELDDMKSHGLNLVFVGTSGLFGMNGGLPGGTPVEINGAILADGTFLYSGIDPNFIVMNGGSYPLLQEQIHEDILKEQVPSIERY